MTWNLDESKPGSSRFGTMADKHSAPSHAAVIITKVIDGGKVKIYQDPKGAAERTEINLDNGKVVVYKDYDTIPTMAVYKRIEILSNEGNFREGIEIVPLEKNNTHTKYSFKYQGSEIGTGYGDVALEIAHQLLPGKIEPRSGMGTVVDGEVINTIKKVLDAKSMRA